MGYEREKVLGWKLSPVKMKGCKGYLLPPKMGKAMAWVREIRSH